MSDLEEYLRKNGNAIPPVWKSNVQLFELIGIFKLMSLCCSVNLYKFNELEKYFNDDFHLLIIRL